MTSITRIGITCRKAMRVMARAFSTWCRASGPRGAPGGRVINVRTDTAQSFPTQVGYGSSKAALEAATRAAARELGPRGITVNCVAPGPVQTGWMTGELVESVLPSIPLGRVGTPEDIAATVAFLAGPGAGWITGQVIRVCGGHVT